MKEEITVESIAAWMIGRFHGLNELLINSMFT